MKSALLAIVGRPNVGKSTLFNRIIGERKAIVEDMPGVTRDRNYHFVSKYELPFTLVDTGGFEARPEDALSAKVVEQTQAACEEADVILAVFDGEYGLHPEDRDLINMVRKYKKPIVCAVNKCDGSEHAVRTAEFYSLGLPEFRDISALHNRGIKKLVEEVLRAAPDYEELKRQVEERKAAEENQESLIRQEMTEIGIPETTEEEEDLLAEQEEVEVFREPTFAPVFVDGESPGTAENYESQYRFIPKEEFVDIDYSKDDGMGFFEGGEDEPEVIEAVPPSIHVALIGRPNVGKSTLFNALLGENRAITSPIAGTTRDSLDVEMEHNGQRYNFVDTAGLRKIGRIVDTVEKYSTIRSLAAISSADVAVLVIDASEGITEQDTRVAGIAHEQGRGLVIAVNKWDLIEKDHRTAHEFKLDVKERFKFAPYAQFLFLSAKSGRRTVQLFPIILETAKSRARRVGTRALNKLLEKQLRRVSAPTYRGAPLKVFYASQISHSPPTFLLVVNQPKGMHFSYLRFIKNTVREGFDFVGTDLKFKITSRKRRVQGEAA